MIRMLVGHGERNWFRALSREWKLYLIYNDALGIVAINLYI